jgi:phosphoglycolate phosphatase
MGAAFFFDLDGTIIDSKPGILSSLRHAMRALDRPLAEDADLDWCIGPPMRDNLRALMPGASPAELQAALDLYRGHYSPTGLYECSPYPGMAEALGMLAPEARLCVVTSKVDLYAERVLSHLGLRGYFAGVYGSRMDGSLTDKGDLIRLALEREALAPESVVMIGDREHDMRGAAKAGVRAMGALWGYGTESELIKAGAQGIIAKTADLPFVLLGGTGAAR